MTWKDKDKQRQWQRERHKRRKEYLQSLKIKQGKCAICGWSEHPEILQFHHIDKSEKEFKISGTNLSNLNINRILKEVEKCSLICPNCHLWIHWNEKEWFLDKARNSSGEKHNW